MSDEGGEDSPPRPKRKIRRVVVMSSSSESDSDGSVGVAGTRRKKLRVLSDDEGGDSSGSSVVRAGARRRRALPQLKDSEADSDSSGWATERARGRRPAADGFSSDSSQGDSDKCSICLLRFTDQQVGTPENCEHIFCLDCIMEWSKNVNTCPVDRLVFNSIVVRACAGGRVLRTQPVKVMERRPSVDMFVIEDLTMCEVCGRTDGEESMLLCDRCDMGYHMQCLTPPLDQIPPDQWLCPPCLEHLESDDEALQNINLSEVEDLLDEFFDAPSGPRPSPLRRPRTLRRSTRALATEPDQPSTSSGRGRSATAPAAGRGSGRAAPAARRRTAPRRKYKRRRTKTVVIEYEVQENGKFPITRTVTRKVKRKVKRRRPRTAARREHVRASVRARLATHAARPAVAASAAPVRPLSLFGNPNELEYFSDEAETVSEEASTAVALRSASSAFSAYRQARRKLVSIPSPPHASAAPDLLADILHSQTLLHSRRAPSAPAAKVDPAKARAAVRQAPSYGHSRGGGWGGGYRGTYRREQTADFNRSGGYGAGPPPRAADAFGFRGGAGDARRDESAPYDAFPRRPRQPDEPPPARRPPHAPARYSMGPAWPPYARADAPPPQPQRRSFGGFEDPVDMRTARAPPPPDKAPQTYRPLTEPPVFGFPKIEVEKSEDEKSDPGLVIDTEKYDPTEPTRDDDSADEDAPAAAPPLPPPPSPPPAVRVALATASAPLAVPPAAPPALPPGVLDTAVLQVLQEHRSAMAPAAARAPSDDESDGDCPNFSIYSAASVHIANSSSALLEHEPPKPAPPPVTRSEDEYMEKVSKRCPITTNKRTPIKIKLNTPSLIKRRVSLYDDGDASPDADADAAADAADADDDATPDADAPARSPGPTEIPSPAAERLSPAAGSLSPAARIPSPAAGSPSPTAAATPDDCVAATFDGDVPSEGAADEKLHVSTGVDIFDDKANGTSVPPSLSTDEPAEFDAPADPVPPEPIENGAESLDCPDEEYRVSEISRAEDAAERELLTAASPARDPEHPDDVEKMTESISETEDERSYTPCLDENRSAADASADGPANGPADAPDDKGLAGLDTELISEDEGHELFSRAVSPATSPAPLARAKDGKKAEATKKKKKKESREKREGKEKTKGKKKADAAFKKLSKSGKERNYRERSPERRASPDARRRRKEKRKDLERYDVRTVVSEKRRRQKDAFGRDVSPRARSPSPSPPRRSLSAFRSPSPPSRGRRSPSPARLRRSPSPGRVHRSPSPSRVRRSPSPSRVRRSPSPSRVRRSPSPLRVRRSPSTARLRRSPTPLRLRRSPSLPRARRSPSPPRRRSPARRRSATPPTSPRRRKRRRSASPPERSPPRRAPKKKKRARASRRPPPSPARKRRRSASRPVEPAPPSPASRPPSPRTPPPEPEPDAPERRERRRRDAERPARRRARDLAGPSKEVFTSGDNILVSVSFKEQERGEEGERRRRRDARRERRRRRRQAAPEDAAKPVAIIDLERSPFRELTPSPENVIVLSDSEPGERDAAPAASPAAPAPAPAEPAPSGPKTPPSPAEPTPAPAPAEPAPPAPDAYDPFEPTRSPSPAPEPAPAHMTLEAAQRSNLSADDVLARRPLTPVEKVMALLASTRDAEVEAEAEAPPAPRIVLPSPTRAPPKLFPGKPSPIKSNPVKPMQAARIARDEGASPYSPGSSDFGELFEPPPRRAPRKRAAPAGKLDDDAELPGSAVELQVKSKFLKKLNRQERVVEEVKLVLKPHYNKKRVSKEEYKDILRRAVPKICHNKSGEINPTKIQALVEAYVKKFRKKHKMGVA